MPVCRPTIRECLPREATREHLASMPCEVCLDLMRVLLRAGSMWTCGPARSCCVSAGSVVLCGC